MIGAVGKVPGVDWLIAKCGVGYDHAGIGHQTGWEGTPDVRGGLVDEECKLRLVCGVEEEMAEAVVGMHDLDLGEEVMVHVRTVQGEGVEGDVPINGICLVRACEVAGFGVLIYSLDGCFSGNFNLEQSISG